METPKEYYYTYYSYEKWGRGYIGSRGCDCLPEEDVNYFGSFRDKTFKPTQKIILKSDYVTREEAYADEIILQQFYKVVENPHFANRAYQTSKKFYYVSSREEATKNGRMGAIKSYNLRLGFHSRSKEQRIQDSIKGGRVAGKICKDLKKGIFSEKCLSERKEYGKKGGKKGGLKSKKLGVGIHSFSFEQRSQNGKKYGKLGGERGGQKAKELGLGFHSLTKEQRRELGKKAGQKAKELGLGICGLTGEQRKIFGKIGGEKTKAMGVGIHSLTTEQRMENCKKIAESNKKNKKGIYALTDEQRRDLGKRGGKIGGKIGGKTTYERQAGIFGLSEEERKENAIKAGIIGGKKGGKRAKELGVGIFGLTTEQRRETGKKVALQKWQCVETGFIANAGNLTKYQRKRGIEVSKRVKIQ